MPSITYVNKIEIGPRSFDVGNLPAEYAARLIEKYRGVAQEYQKTSDDMEFLRGMAGLVLYAVKHQRRYEDHKAWFFAMLLTRRAILRRMDKHQLNSAIDAILTECLGEDKKKELDEQGRALKAMTEALGQVSDTELTILFQSLQPFLDAYRKNSGKPAQPKS